MIRYWISLWLIGLSLYIGAQGYDAQWVMGDYPVSVMDFRQGSPRTARLDDSMQVFKTVANICDKEGNLLFYTNGCYIANRRGRKMPHGDSLSYPSLYYDQVYQTGMPSRQGVLVLPLPGDSNIYYVFHYTPTDSLIVNNGGGAALRFYYSIVDMRLDSGMGDVVRKNVPIIRNELLSFSRMAACRHANGRDWWIVKNAWHYNLYYTFLLTPDTLLGPYIQQIGPLTGGSEESFSMSCFSADGSRYATGTGNSPVIVMDFDRCSGLFSNPDSIYNDMIHAVLNWHYGGLPALSPSGRYLYVCNRLELNQYDLSRQPPGDSVRIVTLRADTNDARDTWQMDEMELAPDGKIYIATWNGGNGAVSVIDYPDSPGLACGFRLYGQPVASLAAGALPYFPNYRLGPLAGSGCDTLSTGLDPGPALPDGEGGVQLIPNPAAASCTITVSGAEQSYSAQIFDLSGQALGPLWTFTGAYTFPVSAYAPGVYLVSVGTAGGYHSSQMLVVQ